MSRTGSAIYSEDYWENYQVAREEIEQEIARKNQIIKQISKQKKVEKVRFLRNVLFVCIFCSMSIIIMCGYVNITHERAKLAQLQNELKLQTDMNKQLKLEIDGKLTLSEIEKIAQQKYSMTYPDFSQVVYITVPSAEEKNQRVAKEVKSNYNNKVSLIINFIKKIF
ncbi:cell division protein FtsL [Caldicellulosiruptor bescii]|uniref:Septum formation initiator n=2 Tax=Caldicellulosiruptor bescii TaxID=31899 RepID=B9MQ94_CALBD|nr:cell division protein FtsL [Caldicellulosiruptor bescii]ACM59886.1 Septum formation initiator [Caldicellulosiruptor bescii DSM 6725]PBC87296.1 cell division protein FtsL [Caldicellulosiruptor bescii]PBC90236.1 cell division protein FtsL [Caldicellulosiruptor bescii]PBD04336.1 cell division protein FtsL [Caldicellulosiruptor bescii]PBD06033.1 cell division protein FtsL [Caldicellulosiruptor bescii]